MPSRKKGATYFFKEKGKINLAPLIPALGAGKVLVSEADLLCYSYDSGLNRALPQAVVLAESSQDVQNVVRFCLRQHLPYVARGAGTNLSGGCIPLKGGVIISLARMNRILAIDTARRTAIVEPGVVNLRLQEEVNRIGYFYAPDPASQQVCTLGGNVAENAGGPRCLKYGVTSNHVLALEMVMPDGEMARFSIEDDGPEIAGFLTGSEGTLGIATRIWVRILPQPESVLTMLAGFPSVEDSIECVSDIIASGILPRTLEGMDKFTLDAIREGRGESFLPPEAESLLLIEVDGDDSRVKDEAARIEKICRKHRVCGCRIAEDPVEKENMWEGRRGAYAAMARIAPNVLVEDGVVPRNRLSDALRRVREILSRHGVDAGLLFHAGDGNLHPNIVFDERDLSGTKKVKKAGYEILKSCVLLGGSISGEHGIGVEKRAAMSWLFDAPTLGLFRRLKREMDPSLLCNPDKILPLSSGPADPREVLRSARPLSSAGQSLVFRMKSFLSGPAKKHVCVIGRGTKIPAGWKDGRNLLKTRDLCGVLDFDKSNCTVTLEAGIEISAAKKCVEARNRFLPLPDMPGSLGGIIAARAWPEIRDFILGMRVLLSNGEIVDLGGKVVKNVAGYDVARLLIGSWGTLGVILDVTLKLPPTPVDSSGKHSRASATGTPKPTPFEPNEWHRRIKRAFDVENLLGASLTF